MLKIRKILLPVASGDALTDTSRYVARQAAWLARHFGAEIILLHAVPAFRYPAGWLESGHEITARDLHSHVVQRAQQDLDQTFQSELEGIAVSRVLRRGDPAREIIDAADELNADLIVLSTDGEGAVYRFLLGSITAKVLHEASCAVWTGAHWDDVLTARPDGEFSIGHVLCPVDLSAHSQRTIALAAGLAADCHAMLTLIHITPDTAVWGPGGSHVDPAWKEQVVSSASREIAQLQEAAGTKANVIIESGSVPGVLNKTAQLTKADVLVLGHAPGRSHLGDNGEGYGIIRASQIPVLSV